MTDEKIQKAVDKIKEKTRCPSANRVFSQVNKYDAKHREAGLHLFYRFDCTDVEKTDMEQMDRKLDLNQKGSKAVMAILNLEEETDNDINDDNKFGIVAVNPSFSIVSVGDSPNLRGLQSSPPVNDPRFGTQPHYNTVNLPQAWDILTAKGAWSRAQDVVVQVLDTGKNPNHEDLQTNKWKNPGEICGNGLDDDGNGYVDDCHGYNHADGTGTDLQGGGDHGTHCTGTVAADTDNEKGVAGVCGGRGSSPGASIMTSVGFGATATRGFEDALEYGADNGARISSNSWGFTQPLSEATWANMATKAAIDYATENGVIVVFAAGNDNSDASYYPGYYEKTVSVAAAGSGPSSLQAASYTNYGPWQNITAPGSNVYSTTGTSASSSYGYKSGTSMACPHIAGILALGVALSPLATNEELLNCLYSTAFYIERYSPGDMGAGMADAESFLECLEPPSTVSPAPTPTTSMAPSSAPSISNAPTAECINVQVSITTDYFYSETSYNLVDASNGEVVMSRNDYPNSYTTYTDSECLSCGDYTFTINDSWGDGICCSYGNGGYEVLVEGEAEARISGGEFGSSKSYLLELECTSQGTSQSPSQLPSMSPTNAPSQRPSLSPSKNSSMMPSGTPSSASGTFSPIPTMIQQIFTEDFNDGWGIFIDGGDDVRRYRGRKQERKKGNASLEIRNANEEASSATTGNLFDNNDWKNIIKSSEKLTVTFWFYPFSFERNENWFLEYKTDDSNWVVAAEFMQFGARDFNQNTMLGFANDVAQDVTVELKNRDDGTYPNLASLSNSITFRFRCDASGKRDKVYIDNVVLDAIGNP
eukprot:CAMPEP_0185741012 /NCGR_PEP_ID=MMETSP1171-20130828/38728_1 /TAXON_ID=374046 /ORGANISM="Helicotheca tamensis, Strain CCMP826" /LENGTH=818 /DNA_ID=CAMNT_0028412949 /DNA_START=165 /DNA_END=2621 /DNA_ORIENTATION=-